VKTVGSEFLTRSKPYVRKLIDLLSADYKYVSVLGTDTRGKVYRISKTGTEVYDAMLAERGFVVRLHNGVNYSEYSFNEIDEDKISDIVSDIKANIHKVAKDINTNEYVILEEEELTKQFFSESEVDPVSMSPEEIIRALTEIKELGCSLSELVVNFRAALSFTRVSKIFLSAKKDLEQSYTYSEASMFCVARRDERTKYYFDGFSGMKGYEVMKEMKEHCPRIVGFKVGRARRV